MQQEHRPLTHDEKKAAEAAFKGTPFDPQWSKAARKVYLGVSAAIANTRNEAFPEMSSSQPTTLVRRAVLEVNLRSRVKSPL
jgi:hypothetical protein